MFTGTWRVVSSPDFDDDYLKMECEPHVRLRQEGRRLGGEYHIGLQTGQIDGRPDGDRLVFSFAGMDEMDDVSESGVATVTGNRLTFALMCHARGKVVDARHRGASRAASTCSAPCPTTSTR